MDEAKKEICQNCKRHKNKPSKCILRDKYVGRKDTCTDFKFK